MSTRTYMTGMIALMVNAVLFGLGAVVVLMTPALAARAGLWLPVVIGVSFLLSPVISWYIAPRLRARRHA